MAAYQQREHLLVFPGETGQVGVLDQVGAVLVVMVVGDIQAHFMHLGRPAQQFAPYTVFQVPVRGHLVEGMQGFAFHAGRLFQIGVIALHQRAEGTLTHVLMVVTPEQVVKHAFAQGAVAVVHTLQFEGVEDRFENRQARRENRAAVGLDTIEVDFFGILPA